MQKHQQIINTLEEEKKNLTIQYSNRIIEMEKNHNSLSNENAQLKKELSAFDIVNIA